MNKYEAEFSVSLALPVYLRLPDSTYLGKHGSNEYLIMTKAKFESIGDSNDESGQALFRVATGELTGAKDVHIPGTMLHYTVVEIRFWKKIIGPKVSESEKLKVRERSRRYLNHFLNLYRFITHDTEVRPLSRGEFYKVRAGRALHFRSRVEKGSSGTLEMGVVFDDADPITMGAEKEIEKELEQEFRERLEAGLTPALGPLLLLNAESYIRTGENKLAVIDLNAALDIIAEKKASELLIQTGLSTEEVHQKLEPMSTSAIVKNFLLPAIPEKLHDNFPWERWWKESRPLRNRVVHDGYNPTQEETEASFETIAAICHFLNSSEVISRRIDFSHCA